MALKFVYYIIAILIFILACEPTHKQEKLDKYVPDSVPADNSKTEEIKKSILPFKVIRTERLLFESKSKDTLKKVLKRYPFFANEFLQIPTGPDALEVIEAYHKLLMNKALDSLYQVANQFYGDLEPELEQLSEAFANYKKYFKLKKLPDIYTAITGMGTDIYVGDTAMVIGLDFFLAEKFKYRPDLPLYIARRYRREYIVPYLLTFYGMRHINSDLIDNSMMAEMIFYGKTYLFVKKMLPSIPDTLLFGFTQDQLADVQRNQKIIWKHFVDNGLLFDTRQDVVTKYVGERPAIVEIGSKCPGRIGRWLGYQILLSYQNRHPEVSFVQLLQTKDAKKIFDQSKYKPKGG